MKKTFLTFLAVGFGFSVAFAQTTEPAATEQPETMEQAQPADDMSQPGMTQAGESRTKTELINTPAAVQEAFENGDYSDMEVLAIYEVVPAAADEATVYEFELAPATSGAEATQTEGLETETVSDQPAVVLYIDENGQITEEKNAAEME